VITVVQYDADMILRLPWFSPPDTDGRFRMWAYSIMRQEVEQTAISLKASGCSAYPFAINEDVFQAVGVDTENPSEQGGDKIAVVRINPELNGPWDGWGYVGWNDEHIYQPDISGGAVGNCIGAVDWPGNSVACDPNDDKETACAYEEYGSDPPDTGMHRNDWVLANEVGTLDSIWQQITSTGGHLKEERVLRVIMYDYAPAGGNPRKFDPDDAGPEPERWEYQIKEFIKIKMLGESSGTCHSSCPLGEMLAVEWHGIDTSCGYDAEEE